MRSRSSSASSSARASSRRRRWSPASPATPAGRSSRGASARSCRSPARSATPSSQRPIRTRAATTTSSRVPGDGTSSFLYAWARATVINTGSIALLAFVFGDYMSKIVPLGPASSALWAALIVIVLTAVNIAGLRASARTQNPADDHRGRRSRRRGDRRLPGDAGRRCDAGRILVHAAARMFGLAMVFVLLHLWRLERGGVHLRRAQGRPSRDRSGADHEPRDPRRDLHRREHRDAAWSRSQGARRQQGCGRRRHGARVRAARRAASFAGRRHRGADLDQCHDDRRCADQLRDGPRLAGAAFHGRMARASAGRRAWR